MDWTALGVIVTGLGLIATIVIFGVESARARRAAISANRRALVGRVIESVERAARAHARFPFGHVRNHAEFEFALVLPRLLVELNANEQHIALWVGRQVQVMQSKPRAKDATRIAYEVALKLADWHSGRTPTSWFSEQLEASPLEPSFRPPFTARASRQFWLAWEVAKVTAISAGTLLALRFMVRKAEK